MPISYVKKLAKKHNISIDRAEQMWENAKQQAKKQNKEDNFAYITAIFKTMMTETLTLTDYLILIETEL